MSIPGPVHLILTGIAITAMGTTIFIFAAQVADFGKRFAALMLPKWLDKTYDHSVLGQRVNAISIILFGLVLIVLGIVKATQGG
jgi:ABC-type uncharacterized transport system permease subunit